MEVALKLVIDVADNGAETELGKYKSDFAEHIRIGHRVMRAGRTPAQY